MHRCIQIYEILELILEAVFYQTRYSKWPVFDRRSVLALLKTCRFFNIPATKLLWKDLATLAPLLLTMPEDLIEVKISPREPFSHREELRSVIFRREALPGDWERFDFYAAHVRSLGVVKQYSLRCFHLYCGVEQELQQRGCTLLPKLFKLRDSVGNPSMTRLFLTSHTHWLKFNIDPLYGASSISQFIVDIPMLAPSLKSLLICDDVLRNWQPVEEDSIVPALETLLENLNLEEFECFSFELPYYTLDVLVQMPRLHTMRISQDILTLAETLELFPFAQPQLKEFSILMNELAVDSSMLPQVFGSLQPALLESFCLQQYGCDSGICFNQDELYRLISVIASCCSPKFLSSFCIKDDKIHHFQFTPTIVNINLFRPLLTFSNLRKLSLPAHPDFTDEEVKALAMAWSLLEELHIRERSRPPSPPRTTLRSLLWFGIYCRHLYELSFSFRGIDAFSESELALASGNPLCVLQVGCSIITESDTTKVIEFMKITFPGLIVLMRDDSADEDDEEYKLWGGIIRHTCTP